MFSTTIKTIPELSEFVRYNDSNLADILSGVNARGDDYSFYYTLKALLIPRTAFRGGDCELKVTYHSRNFVGIDQSNVAGFDDAAVADRIISSSYIRGCQEHHRLLYEKLALGPNDSFDNTILRGIKYYIANSGRDFCRLDSICVFLRQNGMNAEVYYDHIADDCIIFTDSSSIAHWHLIQSLIPRLMPYIFERSNMPVTEKETELLRSLTDKNGAEAYLAWLIGLVRDSNFREKSLRARLESFSSVADIAELGRRSSEYERLNRRWKELQESLSDTADDMRKICLLIDGLKIKIAKDQEGGNEVLDYFLCNKSLDLVDFTSSRLRFIVNTYLDDYDPDLFESYLDNPNSYFYSESSYEPDFVKSVLTDVFGTQKLKLRIANTMDLYTDAVKFIGSGDPMSPTRMPNPHLYHYNCFGNERSQKIHDAYLTSDYLTIIELMVASVSNINFGDGIVGSKFIYDLFEDFDDRTCFERADGTSVSVKTLYEEYRTAKEAADEQAN